MDWVWASNDNGAFSDVGYYYLTSEGFLYFLDTENAERTGLSKGENIRLVLDRNSIDAAIYVGDTQKDLDAALFAGIPFVHAAYGFGTVPSSYPAIHSLDQLPALVRTLL